MSLTLCDRVVSILTHSTSEGKLLCRLTTCCKRFGFACALTTGFVQPSTVRFTLFFPFSVPWRKNAHRVDVLFFGSRHTTVAPRSREGGFSAPSSRQEPCSTAGFMTPVASTSLSPAAPPSSLSSSEAEDSTEDTPESSASFVTLGDAAPALGAAALRLPAFLMTPADEARLQKARSPWLSCSRSSCVLGVLLCRGVSWCPGRQ